MGDTHPLTLDDIFNIEDVVDAQISPDGTQIAFSVRRKFAEGDNKFPASAIWLVPFDGDRAARHLTYGPRADHSPRWSPDGRWLAFLSDREKNGVLQIYVLPAAGGEAQRITDAKGGVSELKWSPDGTRIAYLAPEAESDEEEKRKKERDDAILLDHDYKFARLWVVGSAGGAATALTPAEYQVRSFAWYGDSWAIFSSPTPREDDGNGWILSHVLPDGSTRAIAQLVYGTNGVTGSPDGRALAWQHTGADAHGSADDVWVLLPGESARIAASGFAGGTASIAWLPGNRALLLVALAGTRTCIGRLDLDGGGIASVLDGVTLAEGTDTQPAASVSADGTRLACVLEDGTQPREVWAGPLGSPLRKLTSFNTHLAHVALGSVETIRWQAPDGLEIEGVLVYPSGYEPGKCYPLIVNVHGGPGWQWTQRFMAHWHDPAQWLAAHGYAVLLPNPRGSTGRGLEYWLTNRRAWGIGDLDDVLSGVDTLIARGLADPECLAIYGWSYGGYMTAWAVGHSRRFKAAVVGAGVTDLLSFQAADIPRWLPEYEMLVPPYEDVDQYLRCSPIRYAGSIDTPTLVVHGEKDERVRLGQGLELYNTLRLRGVTTEMVVYPREGHAFSEKHHQRDLLERIAAWFERYIP